MIYVWCSFAIDILEDHWRSFVECVLVSTQMQLARLAFVSTRSYTGSTYRVFDDIFDSIDIILLLMHV